ncbi:MAG: YitT family protein [Pseudoxanthomonas sp.]
MDNLQGIAFGVIMLAFGNSMLKAAGLISGQLAGLSLLGAQVTGISFGVLFVLINLPFYAFGIRARGWAFCMRSLAAVVAVGYLADRLAGWISYSHIPPALAALIGGLNSGAGLIALFRHNTSCGGMSILAMQFQDRTGLRAGWIQLLFDLMLMACAFTVMQPGAVLLSMLGAAAMNLSIAFNHRRDWYVAS